MSNILYGGGEWPIEVNSIKGYTCQACGRALFKGGG
jgi:hypothetical protein